MAWEGSDLPLHEEAHPSKSCFIISCSLPEPRRVQPLAAHQPILAVRPEQGQGQGQGLGWQREQELGW